MSEELQNKLFKNIYKGQNARKYQENRNKTNLGDIKMIYIVKNYSGSNFKQKRNIVKNKKRKIYQTNLIIHLIQRKLQRKLNRKNLLMIINHLIFQ
ncbi:unnamed protein product [Paramecium primaurelia]|uniref:Uncharacterized protein n=1 Tax=Paramecium primaurelia TaxID=5886 RepID=A0A8S1KWH3_PARPR|nr:unnamed protein product [Paramecium primaurelia]